MGKIGTAFRVDRRRPLCRIAIPEQAHHETGALHPIQPTLQD